MKFGAIIVIHRRFLARFLPYSAALFIRTTRTNNPASGESYLTHCLVESRRVGRSVRQVTRLNLGRHFALPRERWPALCARIEQLLCAQDSLVDEPVPEAVERAAQHYVTRLIAEGVMQAPGAAGASGGHAGANTGACVDAFVAAAGASGQLAADSGTGADSEATVEAKPEVAPDVTASVTAPVFVEILPGSLDLMQPRSIGVEHVALAAMRELGFEHLLVDLGVSGVMRTAIIGPMVARMAAPGWNLASHRWLTGTSGLGDLWHVDLPSMLLERLYRASDDKRST